MEKRVEASKGGSSVPGFAEQQGSKETNVARTELARRKRKMESGR